MSKANLFLVLPTCNIKTFGSNDSGAQREKTISPPLGLLYLAAELVANDYNVEVCDYNAEIYSPESLRKYTENADIVGVSMLSFNREHAQEVIEKVNEMRPDLPVIVGGPDCILHPRHIAGSRLTVISEAEETIVRIVEGVLNNSDFSQLPGVMYLDESGKEVNGTPYSYVKELDSLKFPERELLRVGKGYDIIGEKKSRKIASIITSRGCPKNCAFCAHGALAYKKFRRRGAENVLEEIRLLKEQGYEILGIVDDNFTADKRRAMTILKGIEEMGSPFSIAVQGRVDAADFELFQQMKRSGVKVITFGLESGNQDVLDFYNKGTTVEMNENAVRLADKAGLYTGGLLIIGAPFETKEHFERTYRFAKSLPLDVTSFWVLDYTYGSALWEKAHAEGKVQADEYNVPAGKERATSTYPTKEIEKIAEGYFFKYYRRPSYWIRQAVKLLRVRDRYFMSVLVVGIYWLVSRRVRMFFGGVKQKLSLL